MTTRRSFHDELNALQRDLLKMGIFVGDAIQRPSDPWPRATLSSPAK